MDDLESFLQDLQTYENEPVKAQGIIKRISEFFRDMPEDVRVDLLIFLIFKENGVIQYIKKTFTSEENKNNVLSTFQLLEFVLINFEGFCIPYVSVVQHMCLGIVKSNASAKIKENAIKLLKCAFAPRFIVVLDITQIIRTVSSVKESVPNSVKSQLFSLMGIIFEKVPESSHSEKDEFLEVFLMEMGKSRKSTSVMEGCFNGICGYLVNFLPKKEQIDQIYAALKENCLLKEEQLRRVAERSALRIVERHYRVFASNIYNDIEHWRKVLEPWVSKAKEDRQLGYSALVSVYRAVAHIFETSDRDVATCKLNETVEDLLISLMSTFKIASMVGVVELVSTGFVREDLANRAMQTITKRISNTSSSSSSSLTYLPINLECVSKCMSRSQTIRPELLLLAQRIAVTLIDNYPKIDSDFRHRSLEALGRSFYHMRQCGDQVFEEYVKDIIYQGLARNCSHQILNDVELFKDIAGMHMVSYKSFLPLWLYLINASSSDSGDVMVVEKIFDAYVSSFLRINKKLNLRIEMKNSQATDPEEACKAICPNDFKIFVNNVSLFVDITKDMKNPELTSKWLPWIFTEMINSSYKSPLISGFYRVITSCLKMADRITYFWDPVIGLSEKPDSESDQWFTHLQKFLQDVSVRVGRYKGELQISCFQIFLSSPMKLIEPFLRDLVPILRAILRVGAGHLPLLGECLETLERWYACFGRLDSSSKGAMEYLLRSILPYFNVFLQSKERRCNSGDGAHRKWRPLKIRGRVQKVHFGDSELMNIQSKFILFLGKLDQDICKELVRPIDEGDINEGDSSKKLAYDVPLTGMKLRIHMDEMLPRVIELSLSSTDRQTRINSCEFLHSLVLLTFGSMKQMNGELNGLFRKLISACLILGCDSDLIVVQLFEPLMVQMVHYHAEGERTSSQIFADCLMESAAHPFNSTLRDFTAKLIREFAVWSVRGQEPGETPSNLKRILRSMYSFSVHPDHNKRCGAAIVFNSICSIIQEETDVLNTDWFLLYFHFMDCLNMCTDYDDTSHIINAVQYIITTISESSFSPRVKIPSGFQDNSPACLVEYVQTCCTHSNPGIRKLSMGLSESIGKYYSFRVAACMKPEFLKENANVKDYVSWLEYNAAVFSYYNWLLTREAITEVDLLSGDVESLMGAFLSNLTPAHPWFEIHVKRISAVIEMLQFVIPCLKIGIVWHKQATVRVIKTCLFTPGEFKLEFCDVKYRDKLDAIFVELIPRLVDKLGRDEIGYFLDFDWGITRLNSYLHPDNSLHEVVELVNGMKTVHRLGLWDLGFHKMVSGDDILKSVSESMFHVKSRGTFNMMMRPGDRIFLEEFLRFGADIGMSLDVLFRVLTNREEIYDVRRCKRTTKGEFFMDLFNDFVYDCIILQPESSISGIFQNFPTKSLEMIAKLLKHSNRLERNIGTFISELCRRWTHLEELISSRVVLLPVVKSMCMVEPNTLLRETKISEWVYRIMTSVSSLEDVEGVCELVPYLSELHEYTNEKLTSSTEIFYKNLNFFSEKGNSVCPKVIACFEGFLKGFVRTKSLPMLQEITKLLTNYSLKKEEEMDMLSVACHADVPEYHIEKILTFLYGKGFHSEEASSVCQNILVKVLQRCERDIAWKFLFGRLVDTVTLLKSGSLPLKIAALKTVQVCVAGVPREKLENLPDSERGAFRSLIMICTKREFSEGEPELQRKYACACFNTLCTVIAARTSDPLQYRCLIFKDDFSVLRYLVNRDETWSLRMDFEELPKTMKVLTTLRKTVTKERQLKLGKSVSSVKYLEEETLFESSLKEDVTKFDFTSSFIQSVAPVGREPAGVFHVELEMDDLNKHECMVTIISLIEHMVDAGVTPEGDFVPFWLSSILRRLVSLNTTENEKIFLLKLMCNVSAYLKPYAESVIPDLLSTLLDVFHQKPINYLVIDIITMVLNWKADLSKLGARLQATITQLAIYIVNKSDSHRKDIIKNNMEIAKLIIEACRDTINVQVLSAKALEGVQKEGLSDSSLYVNLHFCGVLLANSIPPWSDNNEQGFLQSILRHCRNTGKLGKLAAQVCGMTLRHLENVDGIDRLIELVQEKIQQGVTANGLNDLSLVYSIHKNFPRISSYFVRHLRTCAWTVPGPFQVHCLEMLLSHVKRVQCLENDAFGSTVHSFLEDMCSVDDLEVVALSLRITKLVLRLTEKRMGRLVAKTLSFSECKMAEVRREVYNIAIVVSEDWENRFSRNVDEDIGRQCRVVLLRGMSDTDGDSREKCTEFWCRSTRGTTPTEQFSRVLCDVYAAETEFGFLDFAARLIIRSCVDSPGCKMFIFEHPLVQNSSFRSRNILKTVQPSTIAPMFAQTLTGQLSQPSLLQSPSVLQTFSLQETLKKQDEETVDPTSGESAKRGRRFVRDPKKVQLYFAKKQKMKNADVEHREKIELLREYTDGDYPNIQITHQDLLKPLEMLTMKDPQISRYFLTTVYDGFIEGADVTPFLCKIRELFQQVIEDGTDSNPSFTAFLFHVLLRCEGRIEVDSEWVARLAKSSGCLFLGKLIIEDMIIRAEWDEEHPDRRSGLTPVEKKWLNLAEICRDLKEFEVLRGIFLEKLRVVGNAANAIRSESISHWHRAAELYASVLKCSLRSFSNFYEDAYLNCLARLSDWTKLSQRIQESYDFEDLWSDLGLSEKVLPWLMRSETMRSLLADGGESVMGLVKKVEGSPDKEPYLKKFFVEELAIAHFSRGNFEWLRYHLHQICRNFLSSWSHWNRWSNTLRQSKLVELQLLWELESCSHTLTNGNVSELVDQWSRNRPRDADDLLTWDVKLTCRNRFLMMLSTRHPEVVECSILADFDMVKAGIAQRNVQLSEKYIHRVKGRLQECGDDKLNFVHEYYTCCLEVLRLDMYCNDMDDKCRGYVSAAFGLKKISDKKDVFSFESNFALSEVIDLLQTVVEHASTAAVREVAARLGLTFESVATGMKAMRLEYLEKALGAAGNDADLKSKALMEMVKHYRAHDGYSTEMAISLLRAMSCGNRKARQIFCCLLNEPKFATDWVTNPDLRSVCRMIPSWMYLTWTNQILANLDSDMFPFLKEIVQLLTEEYPNFIRYPFGLSKESYTFGHRQYGGECRLFVQNLEGKLFNKAHLDLLTALSFVTPPDLVFRYDLDVLLAELSQDQPKWDRMLGIVRDLHKRMYGEEYRSFRGAIFDCLGSIRLRLEELVTLEREKSLWMERIKGLVKALPKINTDNVNLKSYSPWLYYHSVKRNVMFELPRQLDDRPILNCSTTIWSFKSDVLVMNSKCRPIRITVLGNDAKEHWYLIKFGEDLRQDQRIQQVFGHMNHVLHDNQHTSALSVDTYNVLPLKCNLGMIEWVSNTSSLYELLTGDEGVRQTMERVQQEHLEFLAKNGGATKAVAAHLNGYLRVSRTEAVARFNERIHSFQWDLLRKAFWRMSLNPEQFVYLRKNFAASQAAIYVAHWLVGIGDRHLDNTLVSSKTGRALGIDFGCAFGFATEFLTPPELIPFRLTPQIVNLVKPMGEAVLIKEAMIQSLRALRRERDTLIAAMAVFLTEPTLDWLERTKRSQKPRKDPTADNPKWNPRLKIDAVKEKLHGVNPVKIFADDLISGHSDSVYLQKYLEVLHGDGSRSGLGPFTEEEQVNCLIDLATDYHILCKTYIGWNPWL